MAIVVEEDASGAITIQGFPGWPGWTFVLHCDEGNRTLKNEPSVYSFEMTCPGEHIDSETVRAAPFGALRRLAVGALFDPFVALVAAEVQNAKRPSGGNVAHSDQVAAVYRAALDQGFPPRVAVARHFDKSQQTASRWITEARRREVLKSFDEETAASVQRMRGGNT